MAAPALSAKARAALDSICDTFAPGGDGLPSATELGRPRGAARPGRAQPAGGRAQAGGPAARRLGHTAARCDRRGRRAALQLAHPGRAGGGPALLGRQPPGPAARRLPGAAQGRAARLLRHGRRQRGPQPRLGRDRLSRPARGAVQSAAANDRAALGDAGHDARLRRRRGRLGRGRRHRRRGARAGGPRRRDRRGRPLLQRAGLRRRRAVRLRPPLRQRRRHGERRRERRPAGRPGTRWHHARQLHVLLPHA